MNEWMDDWMGAWHEGYVTSVFLFCLSLFYGCPLQKVLQGLPKQEVLTNKSACRGDKD